MVKKPKKKGGFFLHFIPYVVAISSLIAAITPHHSEDEIIRVIKTVSNVLALNVGPNASKDSATMIDLNTLECRIPINE